MRRFDPVAKLSVARHLTEHMTRRVAIATLMLLTACQGTGLGPVQVIGPTRSINGSYELESLTVGEMAFDGSTGRRVTINLNAVDRTDMTGTGPCNDFFGDWSHVDLIFEISNWATTKLACVDEQASFFESSLFDALMTVNRAEVDLDQSPARLVMTGPGITIVWAEVTPPDVQPAVPPLFPGSTTPTPGETTPPDPSA